MADVWKSENRNNDLFYGWEASQALVNNIPNHQLRERSALLRIFYICQHVVGGWEPTVEVLGGPSQPLDVSLLMRAALRVFATWDDPMITNNCLPAGNRAIFIRVNDAFAYYEQIESASIRTALMRFLQAIELDSDILEGNVDLEYCFRLLDNFVLAPEPLEMILSGEVARSADHIDENEDAWFESWISPT